MCENPRIIDKLSYGAMIYNDEIKKAIKKENEVAKNYWICYNALSKAEQELNVNMIIFLIQVIMSINLIYIQK